jgi:PAS domain-containing protein
VTKFSADHSRSARWNRTKQREALGGIASGLRADAVVVRVTTREELPKALRECTAQEVIIGDKKLARPFEWLRWAHTLLLHKGSSAKQPDRACGMPEITNKSEEQKVAEAEVESFRKDLGPFVVAAETTRMAMVFADAKEQGHPIIFANDAFLSLTGYDRKEVLGHSFNFLMARGADLSPYSPLPL